MDAPAGGTGHVEADETFIGVEPGKPETCQVEERTTDDPAAHPQRMVRPRPP
jgi:hypothetical protein